MISVLRSTTSLALAALAAFPVSGQQVPDPGFRPEITRPAYPRDQGPRVAVDAAHHNFHTAGGRYLAFAELLRRDGYRVADSTRLLSRESLRGVAVLVIANPLHARNEEDWSLPTPSAYTPEEIAATRDWVHEGGSLLLIVDHMPFPGAAGDLAQAFGVTFSNGFAVLADPGRPGNFTFDAEHGLVPGPATRGRTQAEQVTSVVTFVGSAFRAPADAIPVLKLDRRYVSLEPTEAWKFTPATPARTLEGWCQGALMARGEGRVAVFGEAAMFSAQLAGPAALKVGMNAPEAAQNARFLLNVLHWLSRAQGIAD